MKNSKQEAVSEDVLMNKIYILRGQKIMLDRDLAGLYGVQAKRLREQVKRNLNRFPRNFMFQLTREETDFMVAQNAIPSLQHLGGTLPYAFTEHGILMLANILKSDEAIQMSVRIIEIFVKMRELLSMHKDILLQLEKLEKRVGENSSDINKIFSALKKLLDPERPPMEKVGYKTSKV
ncbi:MAG: ORF6N domain-containing protein [Bacteroidia bacterium]